MLPPTKGYTAPKSAVHFLSIGSHGNGRGERLPTRVCPRRSELQESLLNVHETPMAADLYHHACIHQDLAIPPH